MFTMTRGPVIGAVIAIFMALISQAAWAQTTGSIRGRATDVNGAALPGVTVVLSGDPIGSAQRTSVTDGSGSFRFASLPVGFYSLSANLDGYSPQRIEGVRVGLEFIATVNFRLQEAFGQEITVRAESPIVDLTSPAVSTNYDFEFVQDLPTRGNFYDVLATSPGVVQITEGSAMISAFGSNVQSNQWNIDGLNTSAPEGGYLWWDMNPEMVEETQVLGMGAQAEYGRMNGTAFNVVTKSGTNVFHGSGAFVYIPPDLVGTNATRKDVPESASKYVLDHDENLMLTVGGPILRDRLWFFLGAQFWRGLETWPGTDASVDQKGSKSDLYDLKLSAQPGVSHRLDLTLSRHENLSPSAGDIYTERTAWYEFWWLNKMASLNYNFVLNDNNLLELRGGMWRGDNAWRGQSDTDAPAFVDRTVYPWHWYGGPWWTWTWEQHNDQADVVLTHFANDFAGDHEFKFGVQYNQGGGKTKVFDTNYYYQAEYEYYPGYPYVYQYLYTNVPFMYGGESKSISAFAQDSWKINDRLTIDVGVRYDHQTGWIPSFPRLDMDSNPTGEMIPGKDMVDWDNVAPRLGFAWDVGGNGMTVVRGSVGKYYSGVVSGNWYAPPPEQPPYQVYWLDWDDQWELLWEWGASESLVTEGIRNPYALEYALGAEHQIGNNMSVGVQLLYKKTKDMIGWHFAYDGQWDDFEYTYPGTGQIFHLRDYYVEATKMKGNTTGDTPAGDLPYEQDYRGIFLTFKKRFSNNWDFMGSYSYSKAEGLNPRFWTNSWDGQGGAFFTYTDEADPNKYINADKLLAGDRRHVLRFQGNVILPWDLKLSSVLNFQSGRTYDRHQFVRLPNRGWTGVIAEPASDDLRMPDQFLWDVGIGKHIPLSDWGDLSLDVQVLNVLNDDAPEYWLTRDVPVGENFIPSTWVLPRRVKLRARIEF